MGRRSSRAAPTRGGVVVYQTQQLAGAACSRLCAPRRAECRCEDPVLPALQSSRVVIANTKCLKNANPTHPSCSRLYTCRLNRVWRRRASSMLAAASWRFWPRRPRLRPSPSTQLTRPTLRALHLGLAIRLQPPNAPLLLARSKLPSHHRRLSRRSIAARPSACHRVRSSSQPVQTRARPAALLT